MPLGLASAREEVEAAVLKKAKRQAAGRVQSRSRTESKEGDRFWRKEICFLLSLIIFQTQNLSLSAIPVFFLAELPWRPAQFGVPPTPCSDLVVSSPSSFVLKRRIGSRACSESPVSPSKSILSVLRSVASRVSKSNCGRLGLLS